MRMFENRVHRKVLKPKRDEVTRALRRPYNKEPYDLSSSPNIIWMIKSNRIEWGGGANAAFLGNKGGASRAWGGKTDGKRPLGRPRCRWDANIKMELDLQEVGWGTWTGWI